MNKQIATAQAPQPFSKYAQAIEIPPGSRILHVAGQVGATADGQIPDDQCGNTTSVGRTF